MKDALHPLHPQHLEHLHVSSGEASPVGGVSGVRGVRQFSQPCEPNDPKSRDTIRDDVLRLLARLLVHACLADRQAAQAGTPEHRPGEAAP